jgi:hypothetical protein
MRNLVKLILSMLVPAGICLLSPQHSITHPSWHHPMTLYLALETENPHWQELYDDETLMETIVAASFIPGDWIQSLPDIDDGTKEELPADLNLPEIRPEADIDHPDLMDIIHSHQHPR